MSKVEVLCPNGRRVIVRVSQNTKLLKVLEEACTKQGFLPASDYVLKRGRQTIDVSLSVQYCGLPNLAKLNLVKSTKSRVESSVVVALQMTDSQRLQAEFFPSDTLWHILEEFNNSLPSGQTLTSSQLSGEHPVCICMQDEIVGEHALKNTTLHSLGLTGGRTVLRHVFRRVDDMKIAQIINRIEEENDRLAQLSASSVSDSERSVGADDRTLLEVEVEPDAVMHQPMEIPVTVSPRDIHTGSDILIDTVTQNQLPTELSAPPVGWPLRQHMDFKFPEETKGKNLYHNELSEVNREDFKACDREVVVYSLDEVVPEHEKQADEEIPDEFFEVKESDIRKMWQDLQRQTSELTEKPLMTQASRQMRIEADMSKYKRVIIRVQFPDRVVMQVLLRPTETVHALYKVVRENLQLKDLQFELFKAPPKVILKDHTKTLVEAHLAPMSLVYFGSESKQDHYLSNELLEAVSPQQVANQLVLSLTPSRPSSLPTSASASATSSTSSSSSAARSTRVPSTSTTLSSDAPKWFKSGMK